MNNALATKLRIAREAAGITKDALARAVNLSLGFISQLEAGRRRPSLQTLKKLSEHLKKDLAYFLIEKEKAFTLLLNNERLDKKAKILLGKFKKYCEEYVLLEEVTGHRVESSPLYTHTSAERMAEEERRRLGLGNEPIRDIFSLVELNGLRIIRQAIPEESKISGVFIYLDPHETAFALVNCAQPLGQQAIIAAHEYCHFLKDRTSGPIIDNPDIFIDEYVSLYHPQEQFAQTFAYHFLLPLSMVKEVIEKDVRLRHVRYEDILYLKRYFGVSFSAIMHTLKNLGYLSQAKFEEYQKIDSEGFEETVFGDVSEKRRLQRRKKRLILSSRFKLVAVDAYRKKKITLEELSTLLNSRKDKILSALRELK